MTGWLGRLAPGFSAKLNLLVDLGCLWAALALTAPLGAELVPFGVAATSVWLLAGTALRHYDPWAMERAAADDALLVSVLVMAVATVLAMVNVAVPEGASVPRVGHFLLLYWPLVLIARLLFRAAADREGPLDEVLIVGVGALGRLTGEDLARRGKRRVLGFMRFSGESRPGFRARLLGEVSELESVLRSVPVSEVYVAGNSLKHATEMQAAIKMCERFGVPFALPAYGFRLDRAQPQASRAVSDGYLHYQSIGVKPHQLALKRLFDIVAAAAALWVLLPLLGMVALAIKLSSPGPVFFRQRRVGLHGKPFNMLKFRSMVMNAEALRKGLEAKNEQSGPVFKISNDPRVTAVGRFIRKYSIDELPQLINVLRGDMSVVGPRPPLPSEVTKYESWQRRRLSVRPGLTCIWQVSGRNQISFEKWMYLDMQYIDHWSLKGDLNLILKTVPVVLAGRSAS
ncbi:MAG: sugar transferase [Myxococcaceae bacterium]